MPVYASSCAGNGFGRRENAVLPTGVVECVAPKVKALGAAILSLWQRSSGVFRRSRIQCEHRLAASVDRFDLERRERSCNRCHDSDASLLGR